MVPKAPIKSLQIHTSIRLEVKDGPTEAQIVKEMNSLNILSILQKAPLHRIDHIRIQIDISQWIQIPKIMSINCLNLISPKSQNR